MTPTEQLIYHLILQHQPICDHWLAEIIGANQSQSANGPCNALDGAGFILRA